MPGRWAAPACAGDDHLETVSPGAFGKGHKAIGRPVRRDNQRLVGNAKVGKRFAGVFHCGPVRLTAHDHGHLRLFCKGHVQLPGQAMISGMSWSSSSVILSLIASFFFFHALYAQLVAPSLNHGVNRNVEVFVLMAQPCHEHTALRLFLIGHTVSPSHACCRRWSDPFCRSGARSTELGVTGSYPYERNRLRQKQKAMSHSTVSTNDLLRCSGAGASHKKESLMSIDAHLATLERKHGELDEELRSVQAQPSVHDEKIVDIKRRKLRLKDQINRLRSDTQH